MVFLRLLYHRGTGDTGHSASPGSGAGPFEEKEEKGVTTASVAAFLPLPVPLW